MIGIFDSGAGGLTVLSAVRKRLPHSDVVYFGDTAYAPYGPRTREEITARTIEAMRVLAREKATSVLSACNSVSASLAVSLFDAAALPAERLIEMVGPTVASFRGSEERLLIAATPATIASGIYQNAFQMIGKEVTMLPIPALAGALEQGADEAELDRIVHEALAPLDLTQFDTLVLACTHYPLALSSFVRAVQDRLRIADPAEAVAARVERDWWPREAGYGTTRFLISGESAPFRTLVANLFPESAEKIEVLE